MKWVVAVAVGLVVCAGGFVLLREATSPTHMSTGSPTVRNSSINQDSKRQYTVLLDVSASRPESMVQQGELYVDNVIDEMNYGDQLLLLQMYEETVNEAKQPLLLPLTQGKTSLSLNPEDDLNRDRKTLKEAVHLFFVRADANRVPHTDILTTLSIASEQMPSDKENVLIILSDMLQSSSEWEFEHLKHMPPPGWIDSRKKEGLIRPLYGACVVAVGADPSTPEGVTVRAFWQDYFVASDARLDTQDFRTSPMSNDSRICKKN